MRRFPHLGHNPPKDWRMRKRKLNFIPRLVEDVGRRKSTYIYNLNRPKTKGGNRWRTSMYHCIQDIKRSGGPSAKARQLVLIADNYSQNKNNVNLDFLCELVMRGWYDNVRMLFGPVGHTHNGIDAKHKIHNENLERSAQAPWENGSSSSRRRSSPTCPVSSTFGRSTTGIKGTAPLPRPLEGSRRRRTTQARSMPGRLTETGTPWCRCGGTSRRRWRSSGEVLKAKSMTPLGT